MRTVSHFRLGTRTVCHPDAGLGFHVQTTFIAADSQIYSSAAPHGFPQTLFETSCHSAERKPDDCKTIEMKYVCVCGCDAAKVLGLAACLRTAFLQKRISKH